MRFHGFLVVRDEDDIIGQCLEHLTSWCDNVFVLDTGSTDKTWEIVNEIARRDERVVPFRKERIKFFIGLRGWMLEHYRDRIEDEDWIARLDADEFYPVAPPQFVQTRVARHEGVVHYGIYYFRLTDADVTAWEDGGETEASRERHIMERRRYFQIGQYSEPRLFRYRRTMRWPPWCSSPLLGGLIARNRIPLLHYPHRDPEQMRKRVQLRAEQKKYRSHEAFHWSVDDWLKEVVSTADLADTSSAGDVHQLGQLHYWEPGTELPAIPDSNGHLDPLLKRMAKRLVYGTCVSVLDRFQPRCPADYEPEKSDT